MCTCENTNTYGMCCELLGVTKSEGIKVHVVSMCGLGMHTILS